MPEVQITPRYKRYEVETYLEEENAWVLENFTRVSRKDAELDVDMLRMLGHKSRIVGDES